MRKIYDIAGGREKRLNLSYQAAIRVPLTKIIKLSGIILVLTIFSGFALENKLNAPTLAAETDGQTSEDRSALEAQLKDLEQQILEHQETIAEYQRTGKTLTNEIKSLNAKISQLNLQIKSINLNLEKLDDEITNTQKNINVTENKIDGHKITLAKGVRDLYEADAQSLVEVLLMNDNLSDFFGNINNLTLVQSNIRTALNEVITLREDLLEQKQELALEKEDVETLKIARESQKSSVAATQAEKNRLLTVTKGKESEYQKILKVTQATAAEIRTRIFRLLGGGELTFEEAYKYAKLAEGATGVRAAFLLAILQQESLLGKNVGRCTYTGAMHPTRDVPVFLTILSKLGIDPNSTVAKVSCANSDGAYGGAMGPAQFIPSTWAIYGGWEKNGSSWEYNQSRDYIGKITGQFPSNPWNNADAFIATALYLDDALESSACRNYVSENRNVANAQTLAERCAAARYYAGGRWYYYRWAYGEPVVVKAQQFQKDIDILTAG